MATESASTPQHPPAKPWWRTVLVIGTEVTGMALLIGWIFSGTNGAGVDVAHASAAEGYGLGGKERDGHVAADQ